MSSSVIDKLYAVTDKGPIRALSGAGVDFGGCVFWDPTRFAAKTSSLEIWEGLLLIWAVCAGSDPVSDSARSAASGAPFSRHFPQL